MRSCVQPDAAAIARRDAPASLAAATAAVNFRSAASSFSARLVTAASVFAFFV